MSPGSIAAAHPREVEDLLVLHPKVGDVAVFGVPDAEYGEQVRAVVAPAAGRPASAHLGEELIAFCRQRLAHLTCPRSVEFVDQLPRNDAGKVRLAELRRRHGGNPSTAVGTSGAAGQGGHRTWNCC